jgi:hypothetical protein
VVQGVELVGALLIVGAYLAYTQNQLRLDSVRFLTLNTLGAAVLTVVAAVDRQWGFLLLEAMWTWVASRGLRRALKAEKERKEREQQNRKRPGRSSTRPRRRRSGPNPLRRV